MFRRQNRGAIVSAVVILCALILAVALLWRDERLLHETRGASETRSVRDPLAPYTVAREKTQRRIAHQETPGIYFAVREAGGNAISGARILLHDPQSGEDEGLLTLGFTNADGELRTDLSVAALGMHPPVCVLADGFSTLISRDYDVSPQGRVLLELPDALTFQARCFDLQGNPLAGVKVRLSSLGGSSETADDQHLLRGIATGIRSPVASSRSSADGLVTIRGVPAGPYIIDAFHPSHCLVRSADGLLVQVPLQSLDLRFAPIFVAAVDFDRSVVSVRFESRGVFSSSLAERSLSALSRSLSRQYDCDFLHVFASRSDQPAPIEVEVLTELGWTRHSVVPVRLPDLMTPEVIRMPEPEEDSPQLIDVSIRLVNGDGAPLVLSLVPDIEVVAGRSVTHVAPEFRRPLDARRLLLPSGVYALSSSDEFLHGLLAARAFTVSPESRVVEVRLPEVAHEVRLLGRFADGTAVGWYSVQVMRDGRLLSLVDGPGTEPLVCWLPRGSYTFLARSFGCREVRETVVVPTSPDPWVFEFSAGDR